MRRRKEEYQDLQGQMKCKFCSAHEKSQNGVSCVDLPVSATLVPVPELGPLLLASDSSNGSKINVSWSVRGASNVSYQYRLQWSDGARFAESDRTKSLTVRRTSQTVHLPLSAEVQSYYFRVETLALTIEARSGWSALRGPWESKSSGTCNKIIQYLDNAGEQGA